jgi:hypothetical protein
MMRTSPFIRRATMALSLALFFTPPTTKAQVAANDCSAGSGYYSCEFKDETGNVTPGSLGLNQTSSLGFFSAVVGNRTLDGLCACGLQGSVDGTDLPKKNKDVLCSGQDDVFPPRGNSTIIPKPFPIGGFSGVALAGRISGNPTATLKFKGQLQTFNSTFNSTVNTKGYLFDCVAEEALVP